MVAAIVVLYYWSKGIHDRGKVITSEGEKGMKNDRGPVMTKIMAK